MKDTDKRTLRAFIIALRQQESIDALSEDALTKMDAIAQDLENRVIDLHRLAIATPTLAAPYEEARQLLNRIAAEQGLGGRDFLVAASDEDESTEIQNLARQILSAPDPIKAAKATLDSTDANRP